MSNDLKEHKCLVKSKEKQSKRVLIATYLTIWMLGLIVFWFFTSGSDAMGYSLMFFWILLPVTTFVISLLIGINHYWGRCKWGVVVVFGFMYMLAEYVTFSAANVIYIHKVKVPEISMILTGSIIALAGMGIGTFIRFLKVKHTKENTKK